MKQRLVGAHLSQDELLDRLYGLGGDGVAHVRECEECSSRLQALERRRAEVGRGGAGHGLKRVLDGAAPCCLFPAG